MAKKSKIIGEESQVLDEHGELIGMWTIDGAEVRRVFGAKRFWEGVDEIVRLYGEMNPNEMAANVIENTQKKFNNAKETGSNRSGSTRHALSLPYGLLLVLKDYEPTLFSNKKTRHTFMRRYPALRACNQV